MMRTLGYYYIHAIIVKVCEYVETLLAVRGPGKKFREMNARIIEGLKRRKAMMSSER